MKEAIMRALDTARAKGASYADVRVIRRQVETLVVKNGRVEAVTDRESFGVGVRAVAQGAWGFACSSVVEAEEMERLAARAVRIARASWSTAKQPVNLGPPMKVIDSYRTPVRRDPFTVSLEEK
ncbi:MAG: TldD/PmbA family protein, partial [Chloroflexi bacterium]|nr:TldD/PmbA family protein [Chloroflexota bacterium]